MKSKISYPWKYSSGMKADILRWRKAKRTAKGSSSDWEIISEGNLKLHTQKKSCRNDWYLGLHDSGWLLPYVIYTSLSHSSRYSCMCWVFLQGQQMLYDYSYIHLQWLPLVLCIWCRKLVQRLWRHNIWIQSLQLPLTNWVSLRQSLNLFMPSLCPSVLIFKMGG